jgi:aspartyl-tRNA(Asn)/glutamyl-tRNA(Gln) amidotransferase subunit A
MAQKVRKKIMQEFSKVFEQVDLVLTPTTLSPAFSLEEGPKMAPVEMYKNDVLTVLANIAKLPGISVPAGLTKEKLPFGMQFIGPLLSEQCLFDVAAAFEDRICSTIKEEAKNEAPNRSQVDLT